MVTLAQYKNDGNENENNTMVCNLSSLVLVFLLFATTSYAIPAREVSTICKQAKDPSFCSTLLNSNPNANLVDLTQYTIDIVRVNVTNTIKLINTLIAQSTDPKAKNHYKSCLENFGSEGALGDLDYTQELFKKEDYQGVNLGASSVLDDIEDCVSGDTPSVPPFHDLSKLPQYAAITESVISVLLVLSINLGH
ncbi:hypothetical protein VNO78_19753 [Psophocarpus tetragonolobus]|uniref:Pectinesterase inhibitor domain-containing protein n=1 Tax=Psophocarpus tetragonolobus TaxID=3891 RepID=A0AAN9SC14_PSOTE